MSAWFADVPKPTEALHLDIAVIEDSLADRVAFEAKMLSVSKPWLRKIDLHFFRDPFPTLDEYLRFDGVVLDQNLMNGVKGSNIALQLHAKDWRIKTVVITADNPDWLPPDIRDYTGAVGFKHGASKHRIDSDFGVIRQWVRSIADAKLAFLAGKQVAYLEMSTKRDEGST